MGPFVFSLIFLASCMSPQKSRLSDKKALAGRQQKHFENALSDMEGGRFKSSIKGFEKIIAETENEFLHQSARFNIASIHQQTGECKKSIKILNPLIDSIKKKSIFKAQALIQLHYAYECLGETKKALDTLETADKNKDKLAEVSRLVEIPGRLSILYAQVKQDNQNLIFRDRALDGIQTIKMPIKDNKMIDQTAARLFYIMGRSFVKPEFLKIAPYLLALPHRQMYLIQSYLSESRSQGPAEEELNLLYEKLWLAYKKLPENKKNLYKNDIIKALSDFQKIARESHSPKLTAFVSKLSNKAVRRFRL